MYIRVSVTLRNGHSPCRGGPYTELLKRCSKSNAVSRMLLPLIIMLLVAMISLIAVANVRARARPIVDCGRYLIADSSARSCILENQLAIQRAIPWRNQCSDAKNVFWVITPEIHE